MARLESPTAATEGEGRGRFADAPSIYLALLLFLITVAGLLLLIRLRFLLILLFISLLVASGIAGPVSRLERRGIPRALGVLLIYAIVFASLAALGWYVLPRLLGQASAAAESLPHRFEDVEQLRQRVDQLGQDYPILEDLDARLVQLVENAGAEATSILLDLPAATAKALFSLASIFTFAYLMLMVKERVLNLVLSLTHPRHRAKTQQVLAEMGTRLGAYLRAKAIVVVIVGTLVWLTLALLGSSYAVLVGIFAGLLEVLPRIGPWIARGAIFLAVLPLGWEAVVIAMIAHVVIENLKGYVISPLVESDQVDIHPLTAFVSIIAGSLLLGWVGALIAVPAAAVVQVLVEDVLIPWRRAQLAAAEADFAVGPPAPDAAPAAGNSRDERAPSAPISPRPVGPGTPGGEAP